MTEILSVFPTFGCMYQTAPNSTEQHRTEPISTCRVLLMRLGSIEIRHSLDSLPSCLAGGIDSLPPGKSPRSHPAHRCVMEAITRTAAQRTLEHRLKDAAKWWSTPVDERKGVPPVVETTASGKKTGQPSTAEIACQISAAVFLALAQQHAGEEKPAWKLPKPPLCWTGAQCTADDTLTQVGNKMRDFVAGPAVYATTQRSVEENGLLAARFVLQWGRDPHAHAWRKRLGDYSQPINSRGKPLGETMLAPGVEPPFAEKASSQYSWAGSKFCGSPRPFCDFANRAC